MTTSIKVCTSILLGLLCLLTINDLKASSINTHPTVDLFENIHSGADKKRFVEDATYFSLNETALSQINEQKLETMTLQIPFGATKKLEVNLKKVDFLTTDFKVTVQSRDTHNTLSYSPSLFYRGAISGVKDALVTINFFEKQMTGVLSLNGENYNIGPYEGTDNKTFVIYKERNLNASNPFSCSTEDPKELVVRRNRNNGNGRNKNTVEVYVECDFALFNANSASAQRTTDFATGLFNVVSAIYANDNIDLKLSEVKVWTTADPYPTSSAKAARDAFGDALNGRFDGDIAHLLSNYKVNGTVPNGGSANIDALCDKKKAVGYTNITTNYRDYPTYSWTAYAVTHEIGHNLGSPHTHSCLWPTGPIDNCWCPEGDCALGAEPASTGGTIMSYCHLNPQWTNDCDLSASNPGINLAAGFGQLPGDLIRDRINAASCLGGGGVVLAFQANAKVEQEDCSQANGSITLSVRYGQEPYTYQWDNGKTTKDIKNLVAGEYKCTVTDATGKITTVKATVNGSELFSVNAGQNQVIDCASPIVMLDGSDSPSGFSYSFNWKNLDGSLLGNVKKSIISVSEPGRYEMTVTNTNTGCEAKDTVLVTENFDAPTVNLAADALSCSNQTTIIEVASSSLIAAYDWIGPNNFKSSSANPMISKPGNYVLTVIGANGCTTTKNIEITETDDTPIIVAENAILTCDRPSTELNATNLTNATYNWTGPNNFQSALPNPRVDQEGTYRLKVTTAQGCIAETTAKVTEKMELPAITAKGGKLTCREAVVQLEVSGTTNATYQWFGPNSFESTQQNPMVTQPGTYRVIATGANGCVAETNVTVTEATEAPILTAKGGMIDCKNSTFTFVVSTDETALNYLWTGPNGFISNEKTPSVTVPGNYTLVANNGNQCSTTIEVEVETDFSQPTVAIQGENLTCSQSIVTLKGLSNDALTSFSWSKNNALIGTEASLEITEAGIYELEVTTANGCSAIESFEVKADNDMPEFDLKANDLTCANPTTQIKLTHADGELTFDWVGPNNFTSKEASPVVDIPGNYIVQVSKPNGCSQSASVTINQKAASSIFVAPVQPITCERVTTIIDATASLLAENAQMEWSTTDGNILEKLDDLMIEVDKAGTYALTIRDLDTECTSVEVITIDAATGVSARIDNDKILSCQQSSISLSAGADNYSDHTIFSWIAEDGHILAEGAATSIEINSPGIYTLMVTDTVSGCSDASFTRVTEAERPAVNLLTPEMLSCNQPTTTISGNASTFNSTSKIEWTFNGQIIPNSNTLFLTVNTAGAYTMTIIDTLNGCKATAEMEVIQHGLPQANIAEVVQDDCAKSEGSITLNVPADQEYEIEWNTGAIGKAIKNIGAGIYEAIITDKIGCRLVISQEIKDIAPVALADINIDPITCHDSENGAISVDLQGGNFPYEAQWSNGDNGLEISGLGDGVHTLEVEDEKGCVTTFDFDLNAPNPLQAEVKVLEDDAMVEVFGGAPDYEFNWSDGSQESYTTNLEGGIHEVTIQDANGCSVTQSFEVDKTTSLTELTPDIEVAIYPNPTTDYFKIKKDLKRNGNIQLGVFAASGRQMLNFTDKGLSVDKRVNTEDWAPGTYFVRLDTEEGSFMKKIQVVKL